MFIFLRLLLGHLIGDFPLQFNFIFNLKQKGVLGVTVHALIIFFSCLVFCWPYLHLPEAWAFVSFIFVTHLVQDTIKLKFSSRKFCFWSYILDQLFHAGIIGLVFFTSLAKLPAPKLPIDFFTRFYLNDFFIVYGIVLMLATYNGYYLIRCFHDNFLDRARYNSAEKWYGMVERAAIVTMVVFKSLWVFLLFAVLAIGMRLLYFRVFKEKLKLQHDFASLTEFLLSWSIALLSAGLLFLL